MDQEQLVRGVVRGVDIFSRFELLQKAAAHKGLRLPPDAERAISRPFRTYELDKKSLEYLSEQGIKQHPRPEYADDVFTLVDENPYEAEPGYGHSNYWNFKRHDDGRRYDLRISLAVNLVIDEEKRGVVFWPETLATYVSPADHSPNFRMFKALTDTESDPPAVAKEISTSQGNIVVSWTELGLGGLRSLAVLFTEFAKGNKTVISMGGDNGIFKPAPNPAHQQRGDELFVAEPAQPRVFECWSSQLEDYRRSLEI